MIKLMKKSFKKVLLMITALFCFSSGVFAEEGFNFLGSGEVFKLDAKKDAALMSASLLLFGSDLLFDNYLKLNRPDYNPEEIYNKDNLNFLDRKTMCPFDDSFDTFSTVTSIVGGLSPAVLVFTSPEEWFTIAVMYSEMFFMAEGSKELVKLCLRRARPYNYYDGDKPQEELEDGEWVSSFPSGHTTMAFAGATFATYAFSKYFPDSNWVYAVALGSYSIATASGVARIQGGYHFTTDVISGAVLGAGIGFLVPWLHTFNTNHDLKVNPSAQGLSFTYRKGSGKKL